MSTKQAPAIGMPVTFISPEDNPENAAFIKERLIKEYGAFGLSVRSIENRPVGCHVTLNKYGCMLMDGWIGDPLKQKPGNPARPRPLKIKWGYLRPLTKEELQKSS